MKYISPCLLFFGVLLLGGSLFIGYYLVPSQIRIQILEQSTLVQGNNTRYNAWEVVPVQLYQKVYFFNVTNPADVMKGSKPILQEAGPYVYLQKRRKFDITFNTENDTVFYKENTDFIFCPELSNGSESDELTFINLPYVAAAHAASQLNIFARGALSMSLTSYEESLYKTFTVGELMFDGKYLPYVKELGELNGGVEVLPNNTFGLFYKKNHTDEGRFEIYSGKSEPDKFGEVASWNGKTELDWWNDKYCNQINGTDGVFKPFSTKDRTWYMFIPGFCRSLRFTYDSDSKVFGIPVHKYVMTPKFLESAKTNPDNVCFCYEEDIKKCPENGVFQMDGCGNLGMLWSQPHFYQGSDLYLNQSIGLHPEKERHEMSLFVEPYTSAAARVNMRFQMNVQLRPSNFFRPLKKVPQMIHPLFWIDQSVDMPQDGATTIREELYGALFIVNLVTHIGMIAGCVMIILAIVFLIVCPPSYLHTSKQDKIDGVMYHPQRTGSMEKIGINEKSNEILKIKMSDEYLHVEEIEPFLQSSFNPVISENGKSHNSPNPNKQGNRTPSPTDVTPITSTTSTSTDSTLSLVASSENTDREEDFIDNAQPTINNVQSAVQSPKPLSASLHKQPDSILSPFPVLNDGFSSFSIPDALKDTIEAMSSYENL